MTTLASIVEKIATGVNVPVEKVNAVLNLSSEGATVAFIARYRKENTGGLDEVYIRNILLERDKIVEILDRQQTIIKAIEEQKKLTKELKDKILNCFNKVELEDIYAPYKQKRKTKADIARELGIEPFADTIMRQRIDEGDYFKIARNYLEPLKKLVDVNEVIEHVTNIVVERIAHNVELKKTLRNFTFKNGLIASKKSVRFKEENSKYENYYDYKEKISNLMSPKNSHRILAVKRGFAEKVLSIGVEVGLAECIALIKSLVITNDKNIFMPILLNSIDLAYKNYLAPSIEIDIFNELKEYADKEAVSVFSKNAKDLLLQAPLGEKTVLGVDPGFRTGSKLALVSETGAFLETVTIYPVEPHKKVDEAKQILDFLCSKYNIYAIAIGNGTASREVLKFIDDYIKEKNSNIISVVVNEAGASIYSASDVAREEFPDLDLTIRGSISIARRLQDPLAELVKIDSKSIGVGQYQHDVDQKVLQASLDAVVEDCVNFVGVDVNTASAELLSYVSGINSGLAKNLVEYRTKNGKINSRFDLVKIPRFSNKVFEQCAGFLRIRGGENALDNTAVHPERYQLLINICEKNKIDISELIGNEAKINEIFSDKTFLETMGEFTQKDILEELKKPGRDPRQSFKKVKFNDNVNSISDLKVGMILNGVVSNITNFGVFVDVGVHEDGLAHVSELTDKSFVKDPRDFVNLGEEVKVRVLEVDKVKNQISFSFKLEVPKPYVPQESQHQRQDTRHDNRGYNNQSRDNRNQNNKNFDNRNQGANRNFDNRKPVDTRPKEKPIRVNPNSPFASLLSIRDKVKK